MSSDVLPKMRKLTDKIAENASQLTESNKYFNLEETHSLNRPRVRRLKSLFKHWDFFDKFLRSDVLLDLVEQIIGPNIRI